MANIRVATPTRDDMLTRLIARMDLGSGPATLKVYDGTQPETGDDEPPSDANLLGTLTFSDPAAVAPSGGLITFNSIAEDPEVNVNGIATWARIQDSAGNNVFDGDVHTTDGMIILNTTDLRAGGPLRITSFSIQFPESIVF